MPWNALGRGYSAILAQHYQIGIQRHALIIGQW